MQYVYLVSTNYSGSTLLSLLLNAHPDVTSVGELANWIHIFSKSGRTQEYYCSCGQEIKTCNFWEEVVGKCLEKGVSLDLYNFKTNLISGLGAKFDKILFGVPYKYSYFETIRNNLLRITPVLGGKIKRIMHQNVIIAESILEVTGKKIFFDASKDPSRVFYLSKNNNLDLKIIHLARDPLAVLNSFRKRNSSFDVIKTSKNWTRIHRSALNSKSKLRGKDYLFLRYEDLCENPSKMLSAISSFIGIDTEDLINNVNQKTHHIVGNIMRTKPFEGIKIDESWKKSLTEDEITKCRRITGRISSVLGYY